MSDIKVTKKQIDARLERQLVTYSIVNDTYLGAISRIWKPEYATTVFSRLVMKWCMDYYDQYGKAPKEHITDLYIAFRHTLEDEQSDSVSIFLGSLDEQFNQKIDNIPYVIEQGENFIRLRSVTLLSDKMKEAVEHKDFAEAERLAVEFVKVSKEVTNTIDLTNLSSQQVQDAFNASLMVNFTLPGAFGKLMGPARVTDFIGIIAPGKSAKSFLMNWIEIQSILQGNNVIEFNFEMQSNERTRRFWQTMNACPKYEKDVDINYFYKDAMDSLWEIGSKTEHRKVVDLSEEAVTAFWDEFRMMKPDAGKFKLQCRPSMSIKDIYNELANLEVYEGFIPNVVVIDHPLLMKMSSKGAGWEDVGNHFKELRAFALDRNITLVTAAHTNRGGYSAGVLGAEHTGKSIDILGHVTCAIGIQSTKAEKERGIMRATQLVGRDEATCADQVIMLSCLDLALPHLDSRFLSEVNYVLEKEEKEEQQYGKKKG